MNIRKRIRTKPAREREQKRIYKDPRWKHIRLIALERDKYTCVDCGQMANTVDHIIPVKKAKMLAFDLDNLQSMCESCHAKKSAKERRK